ncbi:PAS domain-containing protein [Natronorubrum halophilum]|uniref:PAS domain-containing protein n=1 Tax=Natronorubrum halophilum TaxID=1702106 RepID=UPI000EF6F9AA|nr:PAS domain-containing protein [Natronorubrum halophilum]
MVAASGRAIRVLCVDEDSEALERADESLVVDTERDPAEALERVHDRRYDCVVCEYELPEMTGLELLKSIRRVDDELPVILFTGAGSEDIASEAISAGVTDYVRKKQGTSRYEHLAERITNAVAQYRTREDLERKSAAMDEAPIGIVISDATQPDNPLIYANQKFQELTGYPIDEIRGRNCRFLQGERTAQEPVGEIRAAIDSREPVTVGLRNYRRNGTMFWNEVTVAPITTNEETSPHFVGFQKDVTRRKLAEERVKRQNARLRELTSVLSHDIRGPLTAATGYLELAREHDDSVPFLDEVTEAHERMATLVEDMLALVRAGNLSDDLDDVSVAAAIDSAWVPPPGVEPELDIRIDEDRRIRADEIHLLQLFENLFENSLTHGTTRDADGVSRVTVTVESLEDGFAVEDDGPGIPSEDRDIVFEAGYTTDENDIGTGLGLRIVKDIVDAHGWNIDVVDGSEGGARFEITDIAVI